MRFLISIFLFISFGQVKAQVDHDNIFLHSIDSIINLGIDSQAFPGAQILVRYKDSIILHKTWGYHTYARLKEVEKNNLYDVASVTKVISGLPILMKLYGNGRLDLDEKVNGYFKALKRSNKKKLSLREILAHQAGLIPYIVFWQNTLKKNGNYKCRTFKEIATNKFNVKITYSLFMHARYLGKMNKLIRKTKLTEKGQYVYSGLSFLVMPQLIEDITGTSFESLLYDSIYAPIGVTRTMYNPLSNINLEEIIPTEFDTLWRKQLVHGTVHDEAAAMRSGISCNAGLFSTAEDLSKIFQLYLNEGFWQGNQIIPKRAINEFTKYQYEGNRRGLGFDKPLLEYKEEDSYVARNASPESYGHSGFTGTMVWADPKYDLVFIFLSNRVYPFRSHRNLYRLGLRPALHQLVYDYIKIIDEK